MRTTPFNNWLQARPGNGLLFRSAPWPGLPEPNRSAPTNMRKLFTLFYLVATVTSAWAEDTAQVSGVIDGKHLQFSPEVRQKLITDSVSLLASCSYSSLHDSSTNSLHFEDAAKQSHLTITFSKPRTVEVPLEEMKVELKEMVITLPLPSGVIWVRSGASISYFAKFTPATFYKLESTLKEAQRP